MSKPITTQDMIRGLVRAAESIEQRDGGKVWDDEVRTALEQARALGWGQHRIGTLWPTEDPHAVANRGKADAT